MRHYEHAHLLSNIEKLPLPIWGSMFPFWNHRTQPEFSFGRLQPHVETFLKGQASLFVASLQSTSFGVSPAEGEGAPGSSGPVHLGRSGPTGLVRRSTARSSAAASFWDAVNGVTARRSVCCCSAREGPQSALRSEGRPFQTKVPVATAEGPLRAWLTRRALSPEPPLPEGQACAPPHTQAHATQWRPPQLGGPSPSR